MAQMRTPEFHLRISCFPSSTRSSSNDTRLSMRVITQATLCLCQAALVRAPRRNSVIDEIRCWFRYANDLYSLCVRNTHVRNAQKLSARNHVIVSSSNPIFRKTKYR